MGYAPASHPSCCRSSRGPKREQSCLSITRHRALSRGRASKSTEKELRGSIKQVEVQGERTQNRATRISFLHVEINNPRQRKVMEARGVSLKNSCITSNPCSRPTFIMSLHRFGTMHMTSTALCRWGRKQSEGHLPAGTSWHADPPVHLQVQRLSLPPRSMQRAHPCGGETSHHPPQPPLPGTGCLEDTWGLGRWGM